MFYINPKLLSLINMKYKKIIEDENKNENDDSEHNENKIILGKASFYFFLFTKYKSLNENLITKNYYNIKLFFQNYDEMFYFCFLVEYSIDKHFRKGVGYGELYKILNYIFTKRDIQNLISRENWKQKTIDLILKNLSYFDIKIDDIENILNSDYTDDEILFNLNKLKFSKTYKPQDLNSDIIRGRARVREIKNMFYNNKIILKTNNKSKYLDIGSGNGIITKVIGESFGFSFQNIYGTEISKWQEKEHENSKTAVKTSYIVGNSLPFDENTFEMVSCIMSIHHFEFKDEMIKEIYRVLKPGGLLIIREHEFDHSKEMKDLIDLEHALYATVIHEKMDLEKINNFWNTYIGDYFSFEDLKNDLNKLHFKSLSNEINIKGPTAYYWCAFRKI